MRSAAPTKPEELVEPVVSRLWGESRLISGDGPSNRARVWT